jgi:hypothetical protein
MSKAAAAAEAVGGECQPRERIMRWDERVVEGGPAPARQRVWKCQDQAT